MPEKNDFTSEELMPQPNIEPIDPEKPIFSFSRFRTYLTCPTQYDDVYNKRIPRTTNIALSVGSSLHFMAETYSRSQIDKNILSDEEIFKLAEKEWKEQTKDISDITDATKYLKFEQTQKMFEAYKPSLKETKAKMVEQHLILYPKNKEWGIQGIVDRVDEDNKICDIKTAGKTPFKKRGTTDKYSMLKMHPEQLLTYAWMLREEKNINVQHAYIDYVIKTKVPKVIRVGIDIKDEMIDSVIDMFDRIYLAIKSNIYPPNRAGNFCSKTHCPFWTECKGISYYLV